jgi:hypothetical protein
MSSEHGIPWEESQLIMSTYLLLELRVHSNRTVWYGALSIPTTEFVSKFGINFFPQPFFIIFGIHLAAIVPSATIGVPN